MMQRILLSMMVMALALVFGTTVVFAAKKEAAPAAEAKMAGKVDLNTATQADLEKLPGVGPAAAKKIIAGRPYKSVADLSKAGIPAATVEKIAPMVAVGGGAAAAAPAVPAKAAETKAAATKAAKSAAEAKPAGKVDLNTASQADLEKLPGVGPAAAKKIIAGRPYKSAADLSKAGIPAKTVEKITPMVAVGGSAAAAPAAAAKAAETKAAETKAEAAKAAKAAKPAVAPPPGKGMVWVNTDSKIYHKEGSKWYGKTKEGTYMSEQEAVKAGYRAVKSGSAEK